MSEKEGISTVPQTDAMPENQTASAAMKAEKPSETTAKGRSSAESKPKTGKSSAESKPKTGKSPSPAKAEKAPAGPGSRKAAAASEGKKKTAASKTAAQKDQKDPGPVHPAEQRGTQETSGRKPMDSRIIAIGEEMPVYYY